MLPRRLIPTATVLALAASLLASVPAAAATPPALTNPFFGFPLPGDHIAPTSARSAGLALADRWLGESPYENPASGMPTSIEASPAFVRTSRQDLSSQNRDFDQSFGSPDFAGGHASLALKGFGLVAYAWQPVLRVEDQSYSSGAIANPKLVSQSDEQRELRAGLAVSRGFGALRLGVSGEWLMRQDHYETNEQDGGPNSGTRVIDFDGSGFGASAGFTYARDPDQPWGSWVGGAIHYSSELTVDGTLDERLVGGSQTDVFQLVREAEWSGGVSARLNVAPATRVVGGLSVNSGSDWAGLGKGTGTGTAFSVGLDWKDSELPWGARFGAGFENQDGATEKKSGLLSAGFTWISGDLTLDLGLIHRNLARDGFPHSADDRAVGTVTVRF